jgi:hypothetical protein
VAGHCLGEKVGCPDIEEEPGEQFVRIGAGQPRKVAAQISGAESFRELAEQ